MDNLIYRREAFAIVGAAMEVHRELGPGFFEAVYQEALEKEFTCRDISYHRESKVEIFYKDELLSKYYVADFICYDKIIVELKASIKLTPADESQLLNYLKATRFKLGLLLNFGAGSLEYKRMIL
jgi:GxxExxY protein